MIYKNNNIEGIHAYYRESDEFFLKIAKVTNNIFYGINKEDDNLRLIKVLKDFNPNLEFCQKILILYVLFADIFSYIFISPF